MRAGSLQPRTIADRSDRLLRPSVVRLSATHRPAGPLQSLLAVLTSALRLVSQQDSCPNRLFLSTARTGLYAEQGSSLVELAILLPMLMFLLVGAADFGKAYYLTIEVASAAEAGALYGVQNPS